ncbi:hypothetical protein RJ639_034173 [Escallonia herrerae]|uniref:cytokinin dehydrogenase n=1 Tax=Escallonia herrerae TaxID=1293975 RepID=A0AA88WSR7_9ASTE|nr:hypothetical protein RJ639_034173 [Escallonia herrerae]
MARTRSFPKHFILLFIVIINSTSIIGKSKPLPNSLPCDIRSLDIAARLRFDHDATKIASTDFGNLTHQIPAAVLNPSSVKDIVDLTKFSYNCSVPFSIAARGHAHSVRGQAMAYNGVVVNMTSLNDHNRKGSGLRISWSASLGSYADVGGEQLWIDVLNATLEHGLAPVSWTDYLYLTVGGTLSNAGISGQAFCYGPQINNVHELDVITGRGEFLTCSKHKNSELFYAVLGGLGQFGIITRARIVLDKAPKRVKWVQMFYSNFSAFSKDQEHLISTKGLDYVEGSLTGDDNHPNNWRSPFFSPADQSRIASLFTKYEVIYGMEVVKYYYDLSVDTVDEELQMLLKELNFIPGFIFMKDASFIDFLNRVRSEELSLEAKGLWDVPHPWLNLFVPKSGIMDFNAGVLVDIIHKQNKTSGPILVYPINQQKWDDRMSAVVPDEETIYAVGFLHSGGAIDWQVLDGQNKEILQFCNKAGIKVKQYLPHYETKEEWVNHFGAKWSIFNERKAKFDPKMILSPGQGIFRLG